MDCLSKRESILVGNRLNWRYLLIKDMRQKDIEENCFELKIKDLKTRKYVLKVIADQISIDQEFSMETGYDTLVLKIPLSEEYVEENGDPDFMEDLEKFTKTYFDSKLE